MEPNQTTPPVIETKPNHKFLFVSIVTFIFVVLFSLTVLWFFPTQVLSFLGVEVKPLCIPDCGAKITLVDDTSTWKTYRNEEYGFEFKYPKEWPDFDIIKTGDFKGTVLHFCFVTNNKNYPFGKCSSIGKAEIFSVYNLSKKEWEVNQMSDVGKLNYLGDRNDIFFAYSKAQDSPDDLRLVYSNLSKILSTFKFTNSTSTLDTSNWKTYRNEEYGFEFKYPGDYKVTVKNDEQGYFIDIFNPVLREKFNNRTDITDQEFPVIYVRPNVSLASLKGEVAFGVNLPFSFSEEYLKKDSWQTYLGQVRVVGKSGFMFRHCEFNDHKYTIFENSPESFFVIDTLNTDNFSYCNPEIRTTLIEPYDAIVQTFKFIK